MAKRFLSSGKTLVFRHSAASKHSHVFLHLVAKTHTPTQTRAYTHTLVPSFGQPATLICPC